MGSVVPELGNVIGATIGFAGGYSLFANIFNKEGLFFGFEINAFTLHCHYIGHLL